MRNFFQTIVGVLVFLAVILASSIAWASDLGDTTALTQLTSLVFEILAPVAVAVGVWLSHRLVKMLEKKTGFDVPAKQEAKIDEWVSQGIHLAAEKSYKKVKEKTEKLKGSEKLEEAADFAFALAAARGWDDWTKDKIKSKIEAKLGEHRAKDELPKLEDKAS